MYCIVLYCIVLYLQPERKPTSSTETMQLEMSCLVVSRLYLEMSCLVPRPIYKVKHNADNSTRDKARLVIKGFQQIEGVDYDETYAPVPKFVTFRMLMALAAVEDFEIDQMDVVTAFLHPELDKEVYMEQPEGYTKSNFMVCRLKKALYCIRRGSET